MAAAKGSPRALDSNSKINVRIHTPMFSQYAKAGEMVPLLTESVNPLLPVKDLFVEARRYAKSNFPFGRCDITYRGMYVEQDATPNGVCMEDDECVELFPTFVSSRVKEKVLPFLNDLFKESLFYVGPVRNDRSDLPIRELTPIINRESFDESNVDELVETWILEVRKEGFEVKDTPTYVLHRDKKLDLGKNIKIKDVIDVRWRKHYFCLPTTQENSKEATSDRPSLDERNIDELVKCIELADEDANSAATGTKRKKKRQGQRHENDLGMGQIPEAKQNPRFGQDPEANRVAVSTTSSNFNEDLATIGYNRKKKKEKACAKGQTKQKAESLLADQVPSCPSTNSLP